MFIKVAILTLLLVSLSFFLLAIRIILKRGGKFPETHIDRNPEMRKLGVKCAKYTDIGCSGNKDLPECKSCALLNKQVQED